MPTRVHILPLSKLVHASPTKWEKLLRDIEEGKVRAFKYYLPLREAVVLFCRKRGQDKERIVTQMMARARGAGGKRGERVAHDNEAAFRISRVFSFRKSLSLSATSSETSILALLLVGSPSSDTHTWKSWTTRARTICRAPRCRLETGRASCLFGLAVIHRQEEVRETTIEHLVYELANWQGRAGT